MKNKIKNSAFSAPLREKSLEKPLKKHQNDIKRKNTN